MSLPVSPGPPSLGLSLALAWQVQHPQINLPPKKTLVLLYDYQGWVGGPGEVGLFFGGVSRLF